MSGLLLLLLLLSVLPALSHSSSSSVLQSTYLEKNNLELAQSPGPATNGQSPPVLVVSRTNRPDILHGFRGYRGGWNLTNKHYWASVGFTGSAAFILGALWLCSFGIGLLVHHFFGWKLKIKEEDSDLAQRISVIAMIAFTCVAVTGCIVLLVGQGQSNVEAVHSLNYVVNQSDRTVQTLRKVTDYLSLSKNITVAQIYLPKDVKEKIDKLNVKLKAAADKLQRKTRDIAMKIRSVLKLVQWSLTSVAALMFLLSLVGFVLSWRGHRRAIHIFIISGWLLVVITFFLFGSFLGVNNAVSDTCSAMGEWADNPHSETALSHILPCVDQGTTEQTLVQTKVVINAVVNVMNQFIYEIADRDQTPSDGFPYYYNQTGPSVPPLCYPSDDMLQYRVCSPTEVSLENASVVWQNFICTVSDLGLCSSPGRLTPLVYSQLAGAVNLSIGLQLYTPPLLSLRDCTFVRTTFKNITTHNCPQLEYQLKVVNAGLALISVGVMFCVALWLFYSNFTTETSLFRS